MNLEEYPPITRLAVQVLMTAPSLQSWALTLDTLHGCGDLLPQDQVITFHVISNLGLSTFFFLSSMAIFAPKGQAHRRYFRTNSPLPVGPAEDCFKSHTFCPYGLPALPSLCTWSCHP